MLYKTDKPIELKNPCKPCTKTKRNRDCMLCLESIEYEANKKLISLLTPIEAGQLTDEEICKILCLPRDVHCEREDYSTCAWIVNARIIAAAQYAADLADRQKERERIAEEIGLFDTLNDNLEHMEAGNKMFRQMAISHSKSLKSKILEGIKP